MKSLIRLPIKVLAHNKLSVFLFHKVPQVLDPLNPNDLDFPSFERLLDSVVASFHVIPLDDAVLGLARGRLPARAACITFDDGYETWAKSVVPALLRRDMHATFYITTGQFEGRPLWHERIANAIRCANVQVIDLGHQALPSMSLATLQDRQAAIVQLERFLKYLTLTARDDLIERLEHVTGSDRGNVTRMPLADLRAIHSKGFGIGAHTSDHPILVYCDEVQARHEIGSVRETLAGLVKGPINSFAYPNGRPFADFSSDHVDWVRQAGYSSAVTTQRGVGDAETSVFQIPRFTPWGSSPWGISLQIGRNLMTRPMFVDR